MSTATKPPTLTEMFLRDVGRHKMTIVRDDGVNRHLRFQKPGTGVMHFEIITWPGCLLYTGDMGTYVFRRLEDMFEFFRQHKGSGLFCFDAPYWAEKLEATDKVSGHEQFSEKLFRATVLERLQDYIDSNITNMVDDVELRREVDEEVLSHEYEHDCRRAAAEFEYDGHQVFPDFYEHSCREFTTRFLWCCHALRWAINQYDAAKEV